MNGCVLGATSALALASACGQQATQVAVRALERSGRAAFVCLDAPSTRPGPALPLARCSGAVAATVDDYGQLESGETTLPHLYALVTQTTRGEIALVDTTAAAGNVIDENPGVPGANFLPIGAQPTDIVSTPGSTASFVGIAEIGREALFALPSNAIRPADRQTEPELSSWPACRLPAAPGEIAVVVDPAKDGAARATCDGDYAASPPALKNPSHGDLSREGAGREKLIVTLPDLGGFVVLDAQDVLDRDAGSFEPCTIERWVPFAIDLPAPAPAPKGPAPKTGAACVEPTVPAAAAVASPKSRPGGIALEGKRMFVADLDAPVVHVVDLPTPCEPIERPPLLPADARDPRRVVITSRVAATTSPTAALKRYVYALDIEDGSAMIFDVSDDATSRYPLQRPHPEWNPFQPPDRVKFTAPAQDLLILTRDVPATNPSTGTAPSGVRCSPDAGLVSCGTTSDPPTTCDVRTLYRTSGCDGRETDPTVDNCTYQSGAGPNLLRGTFGFVLLSSGQLGVVDIDDLDADCRAPKHPSVAAGCGERTGNGLASTQEVSCNIVEPNSPRSAQYAVSNEKIGRHAPGLQSLPLLYDQSGSMLASDADAKSRGTMPFLVATRPTTGDAPTLAVGAGVELLNADGAGYQHQSGHLAAEAETKLRYALAMNVEDPRVHLADQTWIVAWEGGLADYSRRLTNLRLSAPSADDGLYDPNGRYCEAGVQSEAAAVEVLIAAGEKASAAAADARAVADYVQIASAIPPDGDSYWSASGGACSFASCTGMFGTPDVPRPERDLRIREAYQDHLSLELRAPRKDLSNAVVKCCFPSNIGFIVRGGSQWIVQGDQAGFLHHVIADPATGVCRNSCEPRLARRNGRARLAPSAPVKDGDPFAFINPMFRFAIVAGSKPPARDMNFQFTTQGAFEALAVDLAASTKDIEPQALRFLSPTGEIAVTDGSLNGLYLISTQSLQVTRQYY